MSMTQSEIDAMSDAELVAAAKEKLGDSDDRFLGYMSEDNALYAEHTKALEEASRLEEYAEDCLTKLFDQAREELGNDTVDALMIIDSAQSAVDDGQEVAWFYREDLENYLLGGVD